MWMRTVQMLLLLSLIKPIAPTAGAQDEEPGAIYHGDNVILTLPVLDMSPFEESAMVMGVSADTAAGVLGCHRCEVRKNADKGRLEVVVPVTRQTKQITGDLRISIGKKDGSEQAWTVGVDIAPKRAPKDGNGSESRPAPQPFRPQPTLSVFPQRSGDKYSLQVGFSKGVPIPDEYEADFLLSGGSYAYKRDRLELRCRANWCDVDTIWQVESPRITEDVVGKLEIRKGGNVLYTFITQQPLKLEHISPMTYPPPPRSVAGDPAPKPTPRLDRQEVAKTQPAGWTIEIVIMAVIAMAAGFLLLLLERKKRLGEATSERILSATEAKKLVPMLEEQGRESPGSQGPEHNPPPRLVRPAPISAIASLSPAELNSLATRLTPLLQESRKTSGYQIGDSDNQWDIELWKPRLDAWRDEWLDRRLDAWRDKWLDSRLDAWYRRKVEQERRTAPLENRPAQIPSGSEEQMARIAPAFRRGQDRSDYANPKPALEVAEDDGRSFQEVEKGLLLGQRESRTRGGPGEKAESLRRQPNGSPSPHAPSELETSASTADVSNELILLQRRIVELEELLVQQEAQGRSLGLDNARSKSSHRHDALFAKASGESPWPALKTLEDAEEMASVEAARHLSPEPVSDVDSETPTSINSSRLEVRSQVDVSAAATHAAFDPAIRPNEKVEARIPEARLVSRVPLTRHSQSDDHLPFLDWSGVAYSVEYPARDPDLPGYEEAVLELCRRLESLPRRSDSQDLNTFMCQMALEGDRFKLKPVKPADLDSLDTAGRKLLFAGVEHGTSLYLFVPRGLQSVAMGRSYKKLVEAGAATDFSSGLVFPAVLERESSTFYRLVSPMRLA